MTAVQIKTGREPFGFDSADGPPRPKMPKPGLQPTGTMEQRDNTHNANTPRPETKDEAPNPQILK